MSNSIRDFILGYICTKNKDLNMILKVLLLFSMIMISLNAQYSMHYSVGYTWDLAAMYPLSIEEASNGSPDEYGNKIN